MKLYTTALLLLLLVGSLSPAHGILEAMYTSLKCKCAKDTTRSVSFHLIKKIQIFPPGNGCPNTEIVVWTKTKLVICLRPETNWVKKLLQHLHSQLIPSTLSTPMTTRKAD
ncbi:PREDICTED: C-X-C motif chemokine 13 [Dipodomys ordii]|uniref:C-X-C motif chemokine 13 n=1 Tax=Dipodomys ordii TaxID=10020 RepID=A0A1S3FG59_DIPOR|nr:PREDICTED: C-X-C motif chemokine 13 [Dipodomys ordii]